MVSAKTGQVNACSGKAALIPCCQRTRRYGLHDNGVDSKKKGSQQAAFL